MAGGSTSSREQNFWPGFVDALTNVVLVMVFVVVVFAVVMFGAMMKVSRVKVQTEVEKQVQAQSQAAHAMVQEAQSQAQTQREIAEKLQQENQRLTEELRAVKATAGAAAAPRMVPVKSAPVAISGAAPALDVSYALGVTTPDRKTLDALDGRLGDTKDAPAWRVTLKATMAEPSPSEARRLAYYRLAVLRDHFVSLGVLPDRIEMSILDTPSPDGRSHVGVQWSRAP